MKIVNQNNLPEDFYNYGEFIGIESVNNIIADVKKNGDAAISKYGRQFGDGDFEEFEFTKEEMQKALEEIPAQIVEYLNTAINNVRTFAQAQLAALNEIEIDINGTKLGHKIIPLNRVGAYVPGGNYPLPSSAIMSAVPAKVAGVKEVIVCSPRIKPVTLAACALAGVDRVFAVGGVQAIAGMAYGTKTIPRVDKITGPGNKFVTAAKKEVYGTCGIDFLAGPSEVMIIADDSASPAFIAADMLAQAEHDLEARAYLVTTSEDIANQATLKIQEYLKTLKTANIAEKSISNSLIILVDSIETAIEISNKKAPEHLELCFEGANLRIDEFKNYGSLFIGNYSAEVFGDYCSGTNHVLPTNGVARYSGGLSVFDFIKIQTYQCTTKDAATKLSATASNLAEIEGLWGHKLSADLRKS